MRMVLILWGNFIKNRGQKKKTGYDPMPVHLSAYKITKMYLAHGFGPICFSMLYGLIVLHVIQGSGVFRPVGRFPGCGDNIPDVLQ